MHHVFACLLYLLPSPKDEEQVAFVSAAAHFFELLLIFSNLKGNSLNKSLVLDVFISVLRIDLNLRKYPLPRGEEVIKAVRKSFEEEGEMISKNEFISIVCTLYQEKVIPKLA